MTDPNLHWDGTRWLRWDGAEWVDATTGEPALLASSPIPGGQLPPQPPEPSGQSRSMLILWIIIAVIAVLIVAAIIAIVAVASRDEPKPAPVPATTSASPTPTPTSASPTPTPTALQTYTMFYVKTERGGTVYAAGVKSRGDQASGWAGTLQTDDLTCFTGTVSDGTLTGTLVTPPVEGGPAASQPFNWSVSGEGEDLRLLQIGTITGLREVTEATVNDYAGFGPRHSWQQTFDMCANLTGGLR